MTQPGSSVYVPLKLPISAVHTICAFTHASITANVISTYLCSLVFGFARTRIGKYTATYRSRVIPTMIYNDTHKTGRSVSMRIIRSRRCHMLLFVYLYILTYSRSVSVTIFTALRVGDVRFNDLYASYPGRQMSRVVSYECGYLAKCSFNTKYIDICNQLQPATKKTEDQHKYVADS
jgi:hypothetical protein